MKKETPHTFTDTVDSEQNFYFCVASCVLRNRSLSCYTNITVALPLNILPFDTTELLLMNVHGISLIMWLLRLNSFEERIFSWARYWINSYFHFAELCALTFSPRVSGSRDYMFSTFPRFNIEIYIFEIWSQKKIFFP